MNLEKLEAAARALKILIAERKAYERIRDKAAIVTGTPKRIQKASTDMHHQAMHVRRCHKDAWRAIVDADLQTTLGDEVAQPHGYQNFRIESSSNP